MKTKPLRKTTLNSTKEDMKSFERYLVPVKVEKKKRREIGKAAHES